MSYRNPEYEPADVIHLSTRPPLTPLEVTETKAIVQAIKASETFHLEGYLDFSFFKAENLNMPVLMYTGKESERSPSCTNFITLMDLKDDELETLHNLARPSSFGHGNKRVEDPAYRLAREIQTDDFCLNFDPLYRKTGIIAAISAFCKFSVEARLYKLNSYTIGGHFKSHKDTPKDSNHVGTLLLGIPAAFTGGQLILKHNDETVTVDWSTEGLTDNGYFPWSFHYADVEHEILPVASGHRLTIAYDIFKTEAVSYLMPIEFQPIEDESTPIFLQLKSSLTNPEFLPSGGRMAFTLSHKYPAGRMEWARNVHFDRILKGSDALLWLSLSSLELKISVKAVYNPVIIGEVGESEAFKQARTAGLKRYPTDDFSPVCGRHKFYNKEEILMTADSFLGIDADSCESDDEPLYALMKQSLEAVVEWDLIWATKPSEHTFVKSSTFGHYGNEPSTTHSYTSAALIVTIPRIGEGCREP